MPNTTPETATAIVALPYTQTLSVADAGAGDPTYTCDCSASVDRPGWWVVDAGVIAGAIAISIRVAYPGLGYVPTISVWAGDPLSQIGSGSSIPKCAVMGLDAEWLQVPCAADGSTPTTPKVFYIQVTNDTGDAPTADITLTVEAAPVVAAAAGSLLITPADNQQPATVITAADGTIVRLGVMLPGGRNIATAANGGFAMCDGNNTTHLTLYTSTLPVLADVDLGAFAVRIVRAHPTVNVWYALTQDTTLYRVSAAGVVGGTTWQFDNSGVQARQMAVSPDETIAYWVPDTGPSAGRLVKRWDLINNVALSNLLDMGANQISDAFGSMVTLADGSLLIPVTLVVGGDLHFEVRQYSAAAVLLNTYTVLADSSLGALYQFVPDIDSAGFWTFVQDTSGAPSNVVGRFKHIRVSDGAELASWSIPMANTQGLNTQAAFQAPLFGNMTVLAAAISVPVLVCPTLTTGTVGTPYADALTASGGIAPYIYALIAGVLPTGLTLANDTGAISGIPTTAGNYPFTAQVTDSVGATANATCQIDIAASLCTDFFTLSMGDAIAELSARLDDPTNVHWTQAELSRYLVEALRTYSALTQWYRSRGTFLSTASEPFYDLPTKLPILRGYHVTDTDLVTDIEYALMEPPTPTVWTGTEQFTLAQIVSAIQSRLNQFLEETGGVLTRSLTGLTPDSNGRIELPSDVITVRRAAWRMVDGSVIPLKREDEWAMQHFAPAWPQNPTAPSARWPTGYSVAVTPPLVVQLAPAPLDPGTLDLVAVVSGATLDPSTGVLLGVPDDWSWVIKWGALSELLNRDGLAFDPQRAAYCEARYRQGVKLAKAASVVLQGYIDGHQGSLKSLVETDMYRRTWQTTPSIPRDILTAGWNVVALNPPPNGVGYTITLDLVANVPIPVDAFDCLPVEAAVHDCLLDYAQHLATVKEGPTQLLNSMPLFDNFMRCTGITVKLDMAAVPDRPALFDQTKQDVRVKPMEEPTDTP